MRRFQRKTSSYPDVIERAKYDYEQSGLGYRVLAKKHGILRSTVAYLAVKGRWLKRGAPREEQSDDQTIARHTEREIVVQSLSRRLPNNALAPAATPADAVDPILSISPGTSRKSLRTDTQAVDTAVILDFPAPGPSQPERASSIGATAELMRNEKAMLRVALAAICAKMTLEQLKQLDRHEAILHDFTYWLEVYFAPERFVDVAGLDDDDKAAAFQSTRAHALHVLLPTERDTLLGVVKTLSHALLQSVTMKRKIVGLIDAKRGANREGSPDPPVDGEHVRSLVDLSTMSTEDLRAVQRGMELLERHQHENKEAPVPPSPDPIDDLYR